MTKYELLPFIMETTGALSNSAYGFCKQLGKLRESLNCQSAIDSPYTTGRDPLLSALSIELQRANSRMILERTPILDDLIDSAMLKCEKSVSKKKEDAIETLRLQRMRPARVHEQIKLKQRSRDPTEGTSMRGRTVQDSSRAKGKPLKRKKKKKRRKQSQQKGRKIFGSSRRWEPNIISDPWLLNQKPE